MLLVQDADLAFFGEEVPHTFLSLRGWVGIADEHKLLVEGDLTRPTEREGADPCAPSGVVRIDDALGRLAQLRIDLRGDEYLHRFIQRADSLLFALSVGGVIRGGESAELAFGEVLQAG